MASRLLSRPQCVIKVMCDRYHMNMMTSWHEQTNLTTVRGLQLIFCSLQWRHNGCDGVSNHQPHNCLLKRLFRRRSKENSKAPRHWPLCGELTGNWRHHAIVVNQHVVNKQSGCRWFDTPCMVFMWRHSKWLATRALSQYKDRLIYMWRFPC